MPIQKTVTLYAYNELSESAKEKARNWYLSMICWSTEMEYEIENWKELAEKLGFSINHNGGPFWDADHGIFHFDGSFQRPDDADLDALEKEWGPNPETGWAGNPDVLSLIEEVRTITPNTWGEIKGERIPQVEIDCELFPAIVAMDDMGEDWRKVNEYQSAIEEEEESKLEDALSSLNALGLSWIRSTIEYLESEENVAEVMEANDYLFHEDGSPE